MNTSEKALALAFIFALITVTVVCIRSVNRIDEDREKANQPIEITLKDGTPCALNKNGGIACNWKEIRK